MSKPTSNLKRWLTAGVTIGAGALLAQLIGRLYLQWRPAITPPLFAPLLDCAIRRAYRRPESTLAPLRLSDGLTVLEIGGGTGTFTLAAAQQVAPCGRLLTIEIQRAMLHRLLRRLTSADPVNVAPIRADAAALPLPSASVDRVLLIAVLPMVADKHQVLCEVRRVLKPAGLVLISEELLAPEYVPSSVTIRWGQRAGFHVVAKQPGFWCYSVVFGKP